MQEGHEVTVDACVEGTTDVISHTEQFLVEYKIFVWDSSKGEIKHRASNLCVTPDGDGVFTHLRNCSAASKWTYDLAAKTFKTEGGGCLATSANRYDSIRSRGRLPRQARLSTFITDLLSLMCVQHLGAACQRDRHQRCELRGTKRAVGLRLGDRHDPEWAGA